MPREEAMEIPTSDIQELSLEKVKTDEEKMRSSWVKLITTLERLLEQVLRTDVLFKDFGGRNLGLGGSCKERVS